MPVGARPHWLHRHADSKPGSTGRPAAVPESAGSRRRPKPGAAVDSLADRRGAGFVHGGRTLVSGRLLRSVGRPKVIGVARVLLRGTLAGLVALRRIVARRRPVAHLCQFRRGEQL
jgi:hypothetical protein